MDHTIVHLICLLTLIQGISSVFAGSLRDVENSKPGDYLSHSVTSREPSKFKRFLSYKSSYPLYLRNFGKCPCHVIRREALNRNGEQPRNISGVLPEDVQDFVCEILQLLIKSYKVMRKISKLNDTTLFTKDDQTIDCCNCTATVSELTNNNSSACDHHNLSNTHSLIEEHIVQRDETNEDVGKYKKSINPGILKEMTNSSYALKEESAVRENNTEENKTNHIGELFLKQKLHINKMNISYNNSADSKILEKHDSELRLKSGLEDLKIPGIPLSQNAQLMLQTQYLQETNDTDQEKSENSTITFPPSENINDPTENTSPITLSSLDYSTILSQCKNKSEVFVISPYRFLGKFSDYQKYLEKENKVSEEDTYFLLTPDNIFVPQKLFLEMCKASNDDRDQISNELNIDDKNWLKDPFEIHKSAASNVINANIEKEKIISQNIGLKKFFEIYVPSPATDTNDARTRKHALYDEENYSNNKFEDTSTVSTMNYPHSSAPFQTYMPNTIYWYPPTPTYNYM